MTKNVEQKYIGVDGGLNGALVVIEGKKIIDMIVMPLIPAVKGKREYDTLALINFFKKHSDAEVFLEKAQAVFGMGAAPMFTFGKCYGLMIGILTALEMRYTIVFSRTWQNKLFRDQPKMDTKAASQIAAQRLFPGVDFKLTPKHKHVHDGMTDAACIAYYGQNNK